MWSESHQTVSTARYCTAYSSVSGVAAESTNSSKTTSTPDWTSVAFLPLQLETLAADWDSCRKSTCDNGLTKWSSPVLECAPTTPTVNVQPIDSLRRNCLVKSWSLWRNGVSSKVSWPRLLSILIFVFSFFFLCFFNYLFPALCRRSSWLAVSLWAHRQCIVSYC